jgi:hypothetical protein
LTPDGNAVAKVCERTGQIKFQFVSVGPNAGAPENQKVPGREKFKKKKCSQNLLESIGLTPDVHESDQLPTYRNFEDRTDR